MNSDQHEGTPATDDAAMQAVVAGDVNPEIVTLEARMRAAQLTADVATLDELISDELLFAGPDGALATKAQDLALHGSGVVRFKEHTPRDLRMRRVGPTVVVASLRAALVVEVAGSLVQGEFRYTRVWAKEDDGPWRVVGGQVSAVQAAAHDEHTQDN